MTDDRPESDDTGAARLVEALRSEIVDLEDEVVEEDVALPAGILSLLREAPIPTKIAAAVDEVLTEVEPIDPAFAQRLQASLAAVLTERGSGIVYLEQATAHERQRRQLEIGEISEILRAPVDVLSAIEAGRAPFDELTAEQVADWIRFLELDMDEALDALRRSLAAPATAYSGDPRDRKEQASRFVDHVRRILEGHEEHSGT